MLEQLAERFPAAAEMLAEAGPDILAFALFASPTGARSAPTTRKSG
jgi:hypothetical protein